MTKYAKNVRSFCQLLHLIATIWTLKICVRKNSHSSGKKRKKNWITSSTYRQWTRLGTSEFNDSTFEYILAIIPSTEGRFLREKNRSWIFCLCQGQRNIACEEKPVTTFEAVWGNTSRETWICGPTTHRSPSVNQEPMEIEVAGTFLPVLEWENIWSPLFTSHKRGYMERVVTSMHRTSREWRPGGAPTTDEVLQVLLETKGLSIVVVSVVFCALQEKISEWCTECIVILYSIRAW